VSRGYNCTIKCFDQTCHASVVFHMMSALGEQERTRLTAVDNSHDDAKAAYEQAVTVLHQETGRPREGPK
jgi:hypothetical protein